jgi:hypothetical protein
VILLKPHQPARTEGCPMQANATCVTGVCLAHWLLCTSVRVTTQRSAVVTRTYSGPKYAACQNFLIARPNAPGIMASFAKYFLQCRERQQRTTCLYFPNAISFIRGHCVYSGNQGTIGSCNGASAKAAIHLPHRAVPHRSVHLRNQDSHRAVLSNRHPPVLNHEPRARRLPLAIVLPCSFSTNRRPVLPTSKEVLITIIRTPVLGHVGLRWVTPVPGIPALPASRHF